MAKLAAFQATKDQAAAKANDELMAQRTAEQQAKLAEKKALEAVERKAKVCSYRSDTYALSEVVLQAGCLLFPIQLFLMPDILEELLVT